MLQKDPWLLPDGIEEILPAETKQLEILRQRLLDVFSSWGYKLVIPPLIDYLDALLTGSGHDLDLQTFKLTDQLSGELLGIRADMTPQIARIDAHHLRSKVPARLCYVGSVLHAKANDLEKTRSPMQIGAELYGHAGIESDLEIIQLMLEMLAIAELKPIYLDLGHVGIYRALARQANLTESQEDELFDILQRKAKTELDGFLNNHVHETLYKDFFTALPKLNGAEDILATAQQVFAQANSAVKQALAELQLLANKLKTLFPNLVINFDLAELRGYKYHTGIIFAAFIPNIGKEIARGGRYDNIGEVFGQARPATGFSADLKQLTRLSPINSTNPVQQLIFAPAIDDKMLVVKIRNLRTLGLTVIQQLPNQFGDAQALGCNAILEKNNQNWIIKTLA